MIGDITPKYNILITGSGGTLGTALKNTMQVAGHTVFCHSQYNKADICIELSNLQSLTNFESFIEDKQINCIINNAGVYSDTDFNTLDNSAICDILNINLVAPIIISKYLYNYILKTKKQGVIVNINSLAGKYSSFKESIYSASKFGLAGFGSALSMNQRASNISVIDCFFGGIKSNMTVNRINYASLIDPEEAAQIVLSNINNSKTGITTSFEYRKVYNE